MIAMPTILTFIKKVLRLYSTNANDCMCYDR